MSNKEQDCGLSPTTGTVTRTVIGLNTPKSQLLRLGGKKKKESKIQLYALQETRIPGPRGLAHEFYRTFKEDRVPVLCNSYRMPASCYEFSIILIPKWDTYIIQNENYRWISLKNLNTKSLKYQPILSVVGPASSFPTFSPLALG